MDRYSAEQAAIIDRDNRNAYNAGLSMATEINDLWAEIDEGNIGVKANATDVDSMAQGGGMFTRDTSTADGSTLVFAWKASRINTGLANVTVSAGSLTLTLSTVNYVECDRLGNVTSNTSGFTSGRLPLWVITTSASTYTDINVVPAKPFLNLISLIPGAMLSTPAQTKEVTAQLGASISATTSFLIPSPNVAAVLARAAIMVGTTITTSDTDYWTIAIVNLGPAGSGSTSMVGGSTTNTTKVTGGSAITAGIGRDLTLTVTSADLITAAKDVLKITLTKSGSASPLLLAALALDFTFQV